MAPTKKVVVKKAVAKPSKRSPEERLLALLEDPRYASLTKFLKRQGMLDDLRGDEVSVEFVPPPRKGTKEWSPDSEADVLVFEEPCHIKGTLRTNAGDEEATRTLIFLGGVRAKNLFVDDNTETYCFGPCEIDDLFFAAAMDSGFFSFTAISAKVMVGGNGDSWATVVAGSATFDVIDDHVEGKVDGKKIVAQRRKVRAADVVIEDLLEDGEFDRELLLEALDTTSEFLRKEKAAPRAEAKAPIAKAPAKKPSARRFELIGGGSSKFWEISLAGASLTTRFGRIGTEGQSASKSFVSASEAAKAYEKLVSEKTKKGYQER